MATFSHSGIPKNAALRAGYSHIQSARKRIGDYQNKNLVQIPSFYFPHSGFTGALWIEMQPQALSQINTGGRGGTYVTGKQGPIYRFLAPTEGINETHNHEWQVYDNMYAKLLDLYTKITTGASKGTAAVKSLFKQGSESLRKLESGESLGSASDITMKAIGATAFDKNKVKIDSPLAYETSPRRQFIFTFPLLSEGLKTNLVEVVKDIQSYSAPKTPNNNSSIAIEWPHVWSIQSEPRGILDVDLAACTSVQVDWMDPYLGGVPQRCNLTLGFTDISPLFESTIIYGSLVKVDSKGKVEQKSWEEQLSGKGTLPGEIKNMVSAVREQMGYPKTNTPVNP